MPHVRSFPILLPAILAVACAPRWAPPVGMPSPISQPLPGRPVERDPSLANEIVEMSLGYQVRQVLDTPRLVRKISGRPYQAVDVDAFDEVHDSSWFTNRIGAGPLTAEQVRVGPNVTGPPDPDHPWQVVALKTAGVTPGMTVEDSRGFRYVIKFDPPGYPELGSGTECVVARLFHAVGYHVPENYIAWLDPARLTIAPGAQLSIATPDKRQPIRKRPLRRADVDAVLARVREGDGPIRVLASLYLPGIPIGPFPYTGVRDDDPNDVVDHEHLRELRGFYVVASWVNHADMKEENTLDMYDPETRRVTHYLLDFGAAMGSNSRRPSNPRRGQANRFDVKDCLVRLATLGLRVYDYESEPRRVDHPSVGYLDTTLFDPGDWKAMYPVPAFENLTARDAFWGARLVTAFDDDLIRAAVDAAHYSDPIAADLVVRFLRARRDRIGRHWFSRLNPIDGFRVRAGQLEFADLAVDRGYAEGGITIYRWQQRRADGTVLGEGASAAPRITLATIAPAPTWTAVEILPERPGLHARPVRVYLHGSGDDGRVTGIQRLD